MHEDSVTKSKRITDINGAVVSTVELDPWGADTNRSSNAAFLAHNFTTYVRDGNGDQDAMNRRYDTSSARFSQPDPYGGSYDFSDPQSLNRYAYTKNDPVNFRDPSGLMMSLGCGPGTIAVQDGNGTTHCVPGGVVTVRDRGPSPIDVTLYRFVTTSLSFGSGFTGGGHGGGGGVHEGGHEPQKRSDTSGDKDIKPPDVKIEFITPCVQKYLSKFFGGQSLAGIQIQRDYLPPIAPSDARAFTSTGDLISFNKGEYQPNTKRGIELIGHEITHNFQARKYGDDVFGLLYLGDSAVQWVRGRDAYEDNAFERAAFAKEREIAKDLAKNGNPCPR